MISERNTRRIKALAYQLWEEQGRPEGRHEQHWAEAERRIKSGPGTHSSSDAAEGLVDDSGGLVQDTPGRHKSASSRQQTHSGQSTQTGSAQLDGKSASGSPERQR